MTGVQSGALPFVPRLVAELDVSYGPRAGGKSKVSRSDERRVGTVG
ncbi:hypothetical protein PJN25_30025 [Mycobacterium kansasii]